jgi:predicted ATPase
LEKNLQTYSLPLDEIVPLFAALLSVPVPEARYPPLALAPQQQRQQTHDALVAWRLEEAERQPILVVWEDLHWADPSTLELLGLLLEQVPTVPMLNVLTFRPDFTPPWPLRFHMTPLTLSHLERPQVESLIIQLANGKALPSEAVERIVTKTDGIPLFVEELTKMLLASDLLREVADHYELTGPLLTVAIPDTLQESLMARLDQLNTAREVAAIPHNCFLCCTGCGAFMSIGPCSRRPMSWGSSSSCWRSASATPRCALKHTEPWGRRYSGRES